MDLDLARTLSRPAESKIVLLVLDGLGGLPHSDTSLTELQSATSPNLDRLAAESALGLTQPVSVSITPGSGPGHLALFGYDPLRYQVGRGMLEAVGIDFDVRPSDIAARGNFCTIAADGTISDRRAGRISTERSGVLVERLRGIDIGAEIELFVEPVREHRFVLVLRGEGLGESLSATDPQRTGVPPLRSRASDVAGEPTSGAVNRFTEAAAERLADAAPANGVLLRGFAKTPELPQLADVWSLQAAGCSIYPMYRGLAKLAGMTAIPAGETLSEQIASVHEHWDGYDFFFVHYKYTDSAGEDGDFPGKVARIEEVDAQIPALMDLNPDVLIVTGDHSTPAVMAAHSWHPVPFLLRSQTVRRHAQATFDEECCARGSLGVFPAQEVLPLAMAHAGRLAKYGA